MKSSYSDDGSYPDYCRLAARDDSTFASFRSDPVYRRIVETCGPNTGRNYKFLALQKQPGLAKHFEKFVSSEQVGTPRVFDYTIDGRVYPFAPTTLRYINVLSDLMHYFGSLDGMRIVEIGSGYGGQCKIIQDVFSVESYTLVDLPSALELAERYLSHFSGCSRGLKTISSEALDPQPGGVDLVISNYAFSELARKHQDSYWKSTISKAQHGYMLCNFASHTWSEDQMDETQIRQLVANLNSVKSTPPLAQIDVACDVTLLWW